MTQLEGFIEKGWGHEFIWETNDKYCGKFMTFNKGKQVLLNQRQVPWDPKNDENDL